MTNAADAILAKHAAATGGVPERFKGNASRRRRRPAAAGARPVFDGTNQDRRHEDWNPARTHPADLAITHLDLLQRRSRSLAQTAPPFISAVNTIVTNTVGDGFRIQPRPYVTDPETIDERVQDTLLELAEEWLLEVDIDRRLSLAMQTCTGVREFVEAGEFLQLQITEDPERQGSKRVPLSVKLINAERMDHGLWRQARPGRTDALANRITNGIEFDTDDRRVAYHISQPQYAGVPQINHTTTPDRIPVDRMQHVFRQLRIGQDRGYPWLYGAMILCADLDDLIDAELTSAQVAACLAAWISREGSGVYDDDQERDDTDNRPVHRFEPGMIFDLDVGESVNVTDPNRPGGGFEPFASFILRCLAKSLGISYESISGDYRGVNFASGRLGVMAERRMFRMVQHELIQLSLRPTWVAFVRNAILADRVPGVSVIDYVAHPYRYTRALIGAPGWEHQDPLKDVQAAEKRIEIGVSTREIEAAALGRDWRDVQKQTVVERKADERDGIDRVKVVTPATKALPPGGEGGADETNDDDPDQPPATAEAAEAREREAAGVS